MYVFDIETTGLNPFNDGLVTIQIKLGSQIRIWKRWEIGELEMIDAFMRVLEEIRWMLKFWDTTSSSSTSASYS